MKLALNGALTIGTLDGATIEMRDEIGDDDIFIFGLTAEEVAERRRAGYHPREIYEHDPILKRAIDAIANGTFSPGDPSQFASVVRPFWSAISFSCWLTSPPTGGASKRLRGSIATSRAGRRGRSETSQGWASFRATARFASMRRTSGTRRRNQLPCRMTHRPDPGPGVPSR